MNGQKYYTYIPDGWALLEINYEHSNPPKFYKILASWSGGYLDGDSWKMSSMILSVEEDENFYYTTGETGSVYALRKNGQNPNSYALSVFANYSEGAKKMNPPANLILIPNNDDRCINIIKSLIKE